MEIGEREPGLWCGRASAKLRAYDFPHPPPAPPTRTRRALGPGQRHGNERLYNGHTGRPQSALIFFGPTYYQARSPRPLAHAARPLPLCDY